MRAIRKNEAGPGLSLVDVPVPRIGPDEVLIRVAAAGICGTDAHIYQWDSWAQGRIRPPLVLGHEFAGRIVELGSAVRGYAKGDRVSAEGHLACGVCPLCRTGQAHICPSMKIIGVDVDGAFAEFAKMPASNLWKIDDGIPDEVAAIHDPLGNAFHTTMAAPVAGRTVLILGCGPIGLFACGIARASGAVRVIASDLNDARLQIARKMGAHVVVNGSREDLAGLVRRETEGLGVDVALEMSGAPPAIVQALSLVRNGGDVQLLGLPNGAVLVNLAEDVIFKGITVRGILGRRMYDTWYQVRGFLRAGLLDPQPVITHRAPFTEFERALQDLIAGKAGKIVLTFPQ
ncbi:MAG: L-threonine 3-dehydrogenase [Planctomycetes bacterium]|nr:L-threonine 3-dehydrogenase [Planctomycetota bacterium]